MNNAEADGADGGFGACLNFEFVEQGFEVSLHLRKVTMGKAELFRLMVLWLRSQTASGARAA